MKASELRIGNWVEAEDSDVYKQVSGIISDSLKFESNEGFYWLEELEVDPIPLTEEWLIKFGFEKEDESEVLDHWFLGNFEINSDGWFVDYQANTIPCKELKYVHSLQNLYFALTGQELEIKEP